MGVLKYTVRLFLKIRGLVRISKLWMLDFTVFTIFSAFPYLFYEH